MTKLEIKLKDALNVQELIDSSMEIEDKKLKVVFSYNFGDHWNSEVAQPAKKVNETRVKYSDYHNMMAISDETEDNYIEAVVIN